jgi:hypothetical protein
MEKLSTLHIISNKSSKNVAELKYLEMAVINQSYIHEQVLTADSMWERLNYTSP